MEVITITKQTLDKNFVNSWIDSIESITYDVTKIHTITLDNVKLDPIVSYDIFHDFPNVQELNILHSHLNSKELNNLLTYINPYVLSKLNLSGSTLDIVNETDFMRIKSLFSLSTLILPANMDKESQMMLEKLFCYPKVSVL